MPNEELIRGPTAAENLTSAVDRIVHKKLVLMVMTLIYLAKMQAHPAYLLITGIIGTAAIVVIDIIDAKKGGSK